MAAKLLQRWEEMVREKRDPFHLEGQWGVGVCTLTNLMAGGCNLPLGFFPIMQEAKTAICPWKGRWPRSVANTVGWPSVIAKTDLPCHFLSRGWKLMLYQTHLQQGNVSRILLGLRGKLTFPSKGDGHDWSSFSSSFLAWPRMSFLELGQLSCLRK